MVFILSVNINAMDHCLISELEAAFFIVPLLSAMWKKW